MTDQTRHTPAEAVQYWYDAAVERLEERDRLRAVVARIRQMADYWEQQLPEVIRTPAVVSALRAAMEPVVSSVGQAPAPDRTALVALGAEAIRAAACPGSDCPHTEEECAEQRIQPAAWERGVLSEVYGRPEWFADAVLAVLPAPADRTAVLREAADALDAYIDRYRSPSIANWTGAVAFLRRLADAAVVSGRTADETGDDLTPVGGAKGNPFDYHPEDEAAVPDQTSEAPRRGDQFEAWLTMQRDEHRDDDRGQWTTLDNLLNLYRLHADASAGGGAQQPTEARTVLPCNWAHTRTEHNSHDWAPQPGIDPVHCPGFEQPTEARP
jgi:hypothetical protein